VIDSIDASLQVIWPERRTSAQTFPDLIRALGEELFNTRLVSLLRQKTGCGGYHCFQFGPEKLNSALCVPAAQVTQLSLERASWTRDPVITMARRCLTQTRPMIIRLDAETLPQGRRRDHYMARNIRERITLCQAWEGAGIGVDICRRWPNDAFSDDALAWLCDVAETLLALIAKHVEACRWQTTPLISLPEIEEGISRSLAMLPRREAQVCARILFGLSTTGIALDIGVGEETVVTYRKRAYARLGIATQRELMLKYLTERQRAVPTLQAVS
jgi:DNA-binding CsgD family transcriptional regulator